VAEIEGYVQQTIGDPVRTYTVLEQAVQALAPISARAAFDVNLTAFYESLNIVLPNPAATPYKIPAKRFGFLARRVRDRYQDTSVGNIFKAGAKVRALINEHLVSQWINPKIPPLDLLDPAFVATVEQHAEPRAKASAMEHAIRRHCKVHFNEDPAFYGKLVDKLEALIRQHEAEWETLFQAMQALQQEAATGRTEDETPDVPKAQQPYYGLMAQLVFPQGMTQTDHEALRALTATVCARIEAYTGIVNFWENKVQINRLKGDLSKDILYSGIEAMVAGYEKIVAELVTLARHRR